MKMLLGRTLIAAVRALPRAFITHVEGVLEAGKRRLAGGTARARTNGEVKDLRRQAQEGRSQAIRIRQGDRTTKLSRNLSDVKGQAAAGACNLTTSISVGELYTVVR